MNAWLRGPLATLACIAATPCSVALHCAAYLVWWIAAPESPALVICLSLEAIVIGLVIIDKQNQDAARDHEWQRRVFEELLDAVPGARRDVADTE